MTPFKKPETPMMSAMSNAAAYMSARPSVNSAAQGTRRDADSTQRTETQKAEDWTSECMFNCYND